MYWIQSSKIKFKEAKSIRINFNNRKLFDNQWNHSFIYLNKAKYHGMNLDAKLKWKHHITKKKRKELDIRYRKFYWLIERNSQLFKKTLISNQILKLVWLYGVLLWCCSKTFRIQKDILRDRNIILVFTEIVKIATNYEARGSASILTQRPLNCCTTITSSD